jgi:hypothetical protein
MIREVKHFCVNQLSGRVLPLSVRGHSLQVCFSAIDFGAIVVVIKYWLVDVGIGFFQQKGFLCVVI